VTLIGDDEDHDVIAALERIERFFDGLEASEISIETLRERSIVVPVMPPVDEAPSTTTLPYSGPNRAVAD